MFNDYECSMRLFLENVLAWPVILNQDRALVWDIKSLVFICAHSKRLFEELMCAHRWTAEQSMKTMFVFENINRRHLFNTDNLSPFKHQWLKPSLVIQHEINVSRPIYDTLSRYNILSREKQGTKIGLPWSPGGFLQRTQKKSNLGTLEIFWTQFGTQSKVVVGKRRLAVMVTHLDELHATKD